MNPFDIVFAIKPVVVLTDEEKAEAKREARRLKAVEDRRLGLLPTRKRGRPPEKYVERRAVPASEGVVAGPRVRDWRSGEYKPGQQMREAIERARAEQPSLMSLTKKEKLS